MMVSPASSCARIASSVASRCASSRYGSGIRHTSFARIRGTRLPSFARSISQSGWGRLPTSVVGNSIVIARSVTTLRPKRRAVLSLSKGRRGGLHPPCGFLTHELRPRHHRLHLAERHVARQVLHAAIGGDEDVLRLRVRQRAPDP